MKLRVSRNAAEEALREKLMEGYQLLLRCENDRMSKKRLCTWNLTSDVALQRGWLNDWYNSTAETLRAIFPTELEALEFMRPKRTASAFQYLDDHNWRVLLDDIQLHLEALRIATDDRMERYPSMPTEARLYVEDIDSFVRVRDINPSMVSLFLRSGRLELFEDEVQVGLEGILNMPFHQKDWGGEPNDLYTSNIMINGRRRCTAFMLKGKGLKSKKLELKDCGKKGDQILRLAKCASAELFVIQFVGEVSQAVIDDIDGKVMQMRAAGKDACYLIMDAQDTARVLYAYDKLKIAT